MSVTLVVESADDLRDTLPISGVFEMSDCSVLIDYPISASTLELGKMTTILESVIHVVDIEIGSVTSDGSYQVNITEVPIDIAEGKKKFKK